MKQVDMSVTHSGFITSKVMRPGWLTLNFLRLAQLSPSLSNTLLTSGASSQHPPSPPFYYPPPSPPLKLVTGWNVVLRCSLKIWEACCWKGHYLPPT